MATAVPIHNTTIYSSILLTVTLLCIVYMWSYWSVRSLSLRPTVVENLKPRCLNDGSLQVRSLPQSCGTYFHKFPYTFPYRVKSKGDCESDVSLSSKSFPMTALVSFPGSGNTWLRFILQQLTGVATGSVYCDLKLKRNGFPAEGIRNSSAIVIKTHAFLTSHMECFDKAILLVRDPRDAILSTFNWEFTHSHMKVATDQQFNNRWTVFWSKRSRRWKDTYAAWLTFPRPMLVVHYQCLIKQLATEIKRIADFLEATPSNEKMKCVISNNQGHFQRKKNTSSLHQMKNRIHSITSDTFIRNLILEVSQMAKNRSYIKTNLDQFIFPSCA